MNYRQTQKVARQGSIAYLIGASGAGKDTLIEKAKEARLERVIVAPRLVTRKTYLKSNDLYLSEDEFKKLASHDRLALHWRSHGYLYGIEKSLDICLDQGLVVIINGSRGYLEKALELYPDLRPVLITARGDVLKERLKKRARENQEAITERLARVDASFKLPFNKIKVIDNSSDLKAASDMFINFLEELLSQSI